LSIQRKSKILVVIGQLDRGGCERHVQEMTIALNQRGFECAVFAFRQGGELQESLEKSGVRVLSPAHRSRGWLGVCRTAHCLWSNLSRERPDILHFFLPEAYLLGGLVSFAAPSCIRLMSRRSLNHYQRKRWYARPLERFLHMRMDGVLANSQAVNRDLAAEGIPEGIRHVIYNGVRTLPAPGDARKINARRLLRVGEDQLVMVMVANLLPYKGHGDVLEALRSVRSRLPESWLVIMIGADRGLASDLKSTVAQFGLERHVRWEGVVTDVFPYLEAADLALNASHEEGFSNAVLEAMAAGLPQIVTNAGGNPEAITNGDHGLVVEPADPAGLGEAIASLANDAQKRLAMGRAARERARESFSVEATVSSYATLYTSLMRGHFRDPDPPPRRVGRV
jgi:glycosyltransferase involved in cell wall biosynthesis